MTLYDRRRIALDKRERAASAAFQENVARELANLTQSQETIKTQRERLEDRKDDREVLVRTGPGPTVSIYHAAVDYCGRVSSDSVRRGGFKTMFESEAKAKRLRPCSACG